LSLGSIFWGYLSKDIVVGVGSSSFGSSFFNNNFDYNLCDAEFLPAALKNIPFIFTLLGIILSTILINCFGVSKWAIFDLKMTKIYRTIYTFLTQKWHFDQITSELVTIKFMNFGYNITFQAIDKGLIEFFGPSGISFSIQALTKNSAKFQTGIVTNYALFVVFLILFVLFFVLFVLLNANVAINFDVLLALYFGYFLFCFIS